MDADDKENISGYDLRSRVEGVMEADQNKSRLAAGGGGEEGSHPPGALKGQAELSQPVDLTTEKTRGVVISDHVHKDGDRWIKAPLAAGNHSDDEEEVFFGDVTNKEVKKNKKFNSRKTAVFVPGFRMDRRLMRYTMVPPTLTSVGENEEISEVEDDNYQGKLDNTGKTYLDNEKSDEESTQKRETKLVKSEKLESETEVDNKDHQEKSVNSLDEEQNLSSDMGNSNEAAQSGETEPEKCEKSESEGESEKVPEDKVEVEGENGNVEVCMEIVPVGGVGAEGRELVPCTGVAIPPAADDDSPDMESLITEVVNESLHEEPDQGPDCDSLLYYCQPNVPVRPPAPYQPPVARESDLESETSSDEESSDEDDDDEESGDDKSGEEEESKNTDMTVALPGDNDNSGDSSEDEYIPTAEDKENLNCMLRALDNRTAFLNVLSRMNRPGGNSNTKGKPEAFEVLLKSTENTWVESDTQDNEKKDGADRDVKEEGSCDDDSEKPIAKECESLSAQFETLGIQPGDVVRNGESPDSDSGPSTPKRELSEENLGLQEGETVVFNSDKVVSKFHGSNSSEIQITKSTIECPDVDSQKTEETVGKVTEEKKPGDSANSVCPLVFSNRNNSNSNETDVSLEKVAEDISQLSIRSCPSVALSDEKNPEILPNISDDNALAIETIVARAADNDEMAAALPELDVDDIIDILLEDSACDLTTEENDSASGFIVDALPRRICGDNTVVVASNNRISSPSGGPMFPTLPEIPTRIGATHTVTSVLGPISSPGAVRCERRYRSIYATLPNDSIEIETQVVPEREPEKDLLASFGKLDLGEGYSPKCQLNDSLLTGTQMFLTVASPSSKLPQESNNLHDSLCSPGQKPVEFLKESAAILPTASSPLADVGEKSPAERPVGFVFGIAENDSPKPAGFSPSVVFTEKNFSPILEVKFPDSPSVEVPTVEKCTALTSSPNAFTCSSHSVPRDNKRKQPSGEDPLSNSVPHSSSHKTAPRVKTTPTKNKVPRTPPKKVIGQPNVHRFHAAFGKNPASRSLFYKYSIHVSPKTVSKGTPRTPAARQRSRSKSPVSARKPVSTKPPVSSRTPNPTRTGGNASRATPAQTKTPGSTRTPGSARSQPPGSASSRGVPGLGRMPSAQTGKKYTPGKPRQPTSSTTPSSLTSSTSRKTPKPGSHTNSATRVTPMKSLFSRPSPSNRFHGTPQRQTPATPCSEEKRAVLGRRPAHGRPHGTPLRVIDGEVTSSPMLLNSASRTPHSQLSTGKLGVSLRKPTPAQKTGDQLGETDEEFMKSLQGAEAETPSLNNSDQPPVFSKGTPRYLVDDTGDHGAEDDPGIYDEPPPVFDLDDLSDLPQNDGESRESSPRLSMEDVLERKRQQMMNLRAEKRKIQDIISKQGCPSVKSPRANNTVTDSQPKQRLANSQTLALSDKELEAVTQLHTLCNSQRTVKVIHKGRAMLIRQLPQSPHLPRRLSWNENLVMEIEEDDLSETDPSSPEDTESTSGASSPRATTPPKPILNKKDAKFVYPYDNETPPPVVVFRGRGSERHHAKRSPRID